MPPGSPLVAARARLRPALVRGATSVGLLALLLWWLPWQGLIAAIGRISAGVWLLVIASFLAGHAIAALKWRLLLEASGLSTPAPLALRAHAMGLFANLCLPSLVGGDLVRGGLVIRGQGRAEAVALGGLADRLADTIALVLLAGLGALVCEVPVGAHALGLLVGIALLLSAAVAVGTLAGRVVPTSRLPESLTRVVGRLGEARTSLVARPRVAARALALSLAIQGAFVALNWRLAVAIGIDQPPAVWLLVWPLAKLVALAPISLGGIGVREVATAALLAPFGVEATVAVAQSLCWEIVLVGSGLAAGATALASGGRVAGERRSQEAR